MKKLLILPLLLGALILGGCTVKVEGLTAPASNQEQILKGADYNQVETITDSATSTTSALPVKVLDYNTARKYAKLMNDSGTAIYLNLINFSDASAASTTVGVNEGIRLNANGGEYIIGPDNLWQGQVWASSTAASLKILYSEMQ